MSRFTTRRALAGTVLAAAALVGGTGVAHAAFGFDDVNEGDTHANGISWLVDNGITTGCDADSYCPSQPVTRAQMATFMHRLSGEAIAPTVNAATLEGFPASDFVRSPETVSTVVELNNDTFENVSAECPAGSTAIAGGYQIKLSENGALSSDWYAAADQPQADGTGWTVSLRTLDDSAQDAYVTVFATCAS